MRDFDFMAFHPKRTTCKVCGSPELYPRQSHCKKCYNEYVKQKYSESQDRKAKMYPKIEDLDGEMWIELEEEPGFALSNYGRIKSLNYRKQRREALIALKAARTDGYIKLDVSRHREERQMFSIHRLVAKYFVINPKPDEYDCVLHKDENKQNNRWDNLKWGTLSQNRLDYIKHVERHNIKRKVLTDEQVLEIFNSTDTDQAIALKFNIQPSTVWMIKTGYRRSSVTGAKNTDKRHNKNEAIK